MPLPTIGKRIFMMSLKNLFAGLTVAAALAASGVTQAAFIAGDNFDSYTNGTSILNGSGGFGWGSNWGSKDANDATVVNGTLQFSDNNANIAYRQLAAPILATSVPSGTAVYFGVDFTAVSPSSLASAVNAFMGIWLDNAYDLSNSDTHTNVPNFGLKTQAGTVPSPGNDLFARLSGTGGPWAPNSNVVVGDTYKLVLGLFSNGSTFNQLKLWINPVDEFSAPSLTSSAGSPISKIEFIGVRTSGLPNATGGADGIVQIDDLLVADSLDSFFVPVPEPTSLALLGMAGLAGLGRVIRRRK